MPMSEATTAGEEQPSVHTPGGGDVIPGDEDRSGSHPASNADDSSTNTPHSNSQSSTTGTSLTGGGNFKNAVPEDIMAYKDTQAIKYSRLMVLGVLVLSATAAGVLTYLLTTDAEETDFELQVCVCGRNPMCTFGKNKRVCGQILTNCHSPPFFIENGSCARNNNGDTL
jgi:hypothetical protein